MLLRWKGKSSTEPATVTFILDFEGEHPFEGLPTGKQYGQRVQLATTAIADDETPASVAQRIEQQGSNLEVAGSNPAARAKPKRHFREMPVARVDFARRG